MWSTCRYRNAYVAIVRRHGAIGHFGSAYCRNRFVAGIEPGAAYNDIDRKDIDRKAARDGGGWPAVSGTKPRRR